MWSLRAGWTGRSGRPRRTHHTCSTEDSPLSAHRHCCQSLWGAQHGVVISNKSSMTTVSLLAGWAFLLQTPKEYIGLDTNPAASSRPLQRYVGQMHHVPAEKRTMSSHTNIDEIKSKPTHWWALNAWHSRNSPLSIQPPWTRQSRWPRVSRCTGVSSGTIVSGITSYSLLRRWRGGKKKKWGNNHYFWFLKGWLCEKPKKGRKNSFSKPHLSFGARFTRQTLSQQTGTLSHFHIYHLDPSSLPQRHSSSNNLKVSTSIPAAGRNQHASALQCHVNSWFAIWIITLICMQLENQSTSFELQHGGKLFFLCCLWCLHSHLLKLSCPRKVLRWIYVPQSLFLPFHLFRQPIPQRQGLPKSDGGKTKRVGGGGVVSDQWLERIIFEHWAEAEVEILTTSPFDPTLPWKPWEEKRDWVHFDWIKL